MPMPAAAAVTAYPGALPADVGAVSEPPHESSESAERNPALRLAGGVLVLNAVLVLLEKLLLPDTGGGALPGASNVAPAVIDAVLGVSLLSGNEKYRGFATVRVVLGMVLLTGLLLARGEVLQSVFQLIFSGALLMLLLGSPSGLRRGVALAGVGLCLLLEVTGLYFARTGGMPFARKIMDASLGAEPVTGGVVEGRSFPFYVPLPSESWMLRREEAAKKDNPLADRWLVDSKSGAHFLIIGETVPVRAQVSMERFASTVTDNLRKGVQDFVPSSPDFSVFEGMPACTIRGTGKVNGLPVDYEIRLLSAPGAIYQLIAFGSSAEFPKVRGEIVAAMDGFRMK